MSWGFAKVILLGEHAVVYGHPALAAAIARGVDISSRYAAATTLTIPEWDLAVAIDEDHPVAAALRALVAATGHGDPHLELLGHASVPAAAGLGSSAALAVALARAVARAARRPISAAEIAVHADACERCFHDNPSGIDVALAVAGGIGCFTRGVGLEPIASPALTLVIGLSGEARRTGDVVSRVATTVASSATARAAVAELGAIARAGAEALTRADLTSFAPMLSAAHRHLAQLGVSTPTLDAMVTAAIRAGATGAKLTGAGDGGAVIALAPQREIEVLRAWRDLDKHAFICEVGVTRAEAIPS